MNSQTEMKTSLTV